MLNVVVACLLAKQYEKKEIKKSMAQCLIERCYDAVIIIISHVIITGKRILKRKRCWLRIVIGPMKSNDNSGIFLPYHLPELTSHIIWFTFRYEDCFAGCASVSCDNPRDRMQPCYPFCEAGCVCIQPYVRDDRTHKCVLPDECTK